MTDHKTEALSKCEQIAGVDEQTNQITLAIEAQVHATLALVDEQRTANLIALLAVEGGPYRELNRSSNWQATYENVLDRMSEGPTNE